jgi:hypothetical protein
VSHFWRATFPEAFARKAHQRIRQRQQTAFTPTTIGAIMSIMTDRQQKITFGEMREMGVRGLLIYCADYRCSHSIAISANSLAR